MKPFISLLSLSLLMAVSFGEASAQAAPAASRGASPPPPAPAPGSAGIFRANADLQAALARSIANGGAMASASITVTDEYRGSLVHRTEPNGAIQHAGNTEMHYIIEGSGTVETGGTVVRRDGAMAVIQGGASHRVVPGDVIVIPAGSPHRYSEVVEPITYLEFRFLAPLRAGSVEAQQSRTILFIGNSFTFGSGSAVRYWRANTVTDLNAEGIGGVPALFESFTEQVGLSYDVYLETRGDSAFDFHLREKRAEITSRPWDVVVAHSYSTLDRDAPNDPTDLLATGRELADVLHERSPAVELYVTATWSRPDMTYPEGTPWHGKAIEVMGSDVDRAYDRLAAEVPGVKAVNPVGEAFNRAIRTGVADGNPYDGIDADKVDLWTFDHYHASTYGYYLHALVVFGNVTGVDPRVLGRGECSGYELGMSGDQVEALQQVAHDELVAAGVRLSTPAGRTPPGRGAACGPL